MRTSGENVIILDEAERVQSVSYSHIRSLSGLGLYTLVILREGKRGTCFGPPFTTVICKVPCFRRGPTATVMHKHFSFKGPPNFTDF